MLRGDGENELSDNEHETVRIYLKVSILSGELNHILRNERKRERERQRETDRESGRERFHEWEWEKKITLVREWKNDETERLRVNA